jgi:hypothetical protein
MVDVWFIVCDSFEGLNSYYIHSVWDSKEAAEYIARTECENVVGVFSKPVQTKESIEKNLQRENIEGRMKVSEDIISIEDKELKIMIFTDDSAMALKPYIQAIWNTEKLKIQNGDYDIQRRWDTKNYYLENCADGYFKVYKATKYKITQFFNGTLEGYPEALENRKNMRMSVYVFIRIRKKEYEDLKSKI